MLEGEAWDCNPFIDQSEIAAQIAGDDIDEEDDTGDWQTVVLERWGDRQVNGEWGEKGDGLRRF